MVNDPESLAKRTLDGQTMRRIQIHGVRCRFTCRGGEVVLTFKYDGLEYDCAAALPATLDGRTTKIAEILSRAEKCIRQLKGVKPTA